MKILAFASLIAAALPLTAHAEDLPADVFPSAPADAFQDVLIFADEHPVIARLRVEVGGVGFRRNYRDFLGRLHAYLDGDRDGRLTPDEVKRGDWRQMFQGTPFNGGAPAGGTGAEADGDGDGRVSIAELGDYLVAASGVTPVAVQGGPPADPRTERAFEHLDRDGDGRLGTAERAAAAASLERLDMDGDEWVTLDEMNPYDDPNSRRFFGGQAGGGEPPAGHPFAVLGPDTDRDALAGRLLGKYDRDGDGDLDAAELALPADAVPEGLDRDDLAAWLDAPAHHLDLKAELHPNLPGGRYGGQSRLVLGTSTDAMADRVRDLGDQTIALDLGPTVVELKVSTSYSDYRSFFDQQFDAADADGNDYVDKGEADRNGLISNLFTAADRDGNGQLFKPELMAYLDRIDDAISSRVALAVSDRGRSVFQAIDPSDDLRLSPRERLGLPDRLAALAPAGRDVLRFDDFPRRYRLNIGLGPDNAGPQAVFIGGAVAAPNAAAPTGGAPSWFSEMDRNGDGDVSLREFLGPLAAFDRLDTDGDGLLSAAESDRRRGD